MVRGRRALMAVSILLAFLCEAGAQQSHVDRYDQNIRLMADGSDISTRTVTVEFDEPDTHYHFWLSNSVKSGSYTFRYHHVLISAEADLGAGFKPIESSVTSGSTWTCVLGDGQQFFNHRVTFRLKIHSWGDTFRHGEGAGYHDTAVPYQTGEGTRSNVTVEIPAAAAEGARFVFVVGPSNSLDGAMVCRSVPAYVVPGFVEAHYVAPNSATFKMLRPMAKGDAIVAAVYMPGGGVAKTSTYYRANPFAVNSQGGIFVLVAFAAMAVAGGIAAMVLVISRKGRPTPPPPLS